MTHALLYCARMIAKVFLAVGVLFLLAIAVEWIALQGAPYLVIGAAVSTVLLLLRRQV